MVRQTALTRSGAGSIPAGGTTRIAGRMARQPVFTRRDVGSIPTRCALPLVYVASTPPCEGGRVGSTPTRLTAVSSGGCASLISCVAAGFDSPYRYYGSEASRVMRLFRKEEAQGSTPWWASATRVVFLLGLVSQSAEDAGSNPARCEFESHPAYRRVTQSAEVVVREATQCGFESHRADHACLAQPAEALGLGPRGYRFESCGGHRAYS